MLKPIFCLVGPSTSGKSTVWKNMHDIQEQFDYKFDTIVSHTTRDRREGEVDGVDYRYVSDETFDQLNRIEEVEYAGNRYCIAEEEICNKLHSSSDFLVVIVDYHGYQQIKSFHNNTYLVYFDISAFTAIRRLIKRDGIIQGFKRFKHAIENNEFDRKDYDILLKTDEMEPTQSARKLYREIANQITRSKFYRRFSA